MKLGPIGVGRLGTATDGPLRCFVPDGAPVVGAFDEDSNVSVPGAESIFLRLEEEKFFLNVPELVVGLVKRPGESGIETTLSSLSADVTLVSAGVEGMMLGIMSAALDPGNGDNSLVVSAPVVKLALKARLGNVSCESVVADADFGGSVKACVGAIGEGMDDGWVLGPAEIDADSILLSVSIFNCFASFPDSLRSRTPGVELDLTLVGLDGVLFDNCIVGETTVFWGGAGSATEGGGYEGGGNVLPCSWETNDGSPGASATVEREVPAVVGFEPSELAHVRPEKPLESDCRGKADLD